MKKITAACLMTLLPWSVNACGTSEPEMAQRNQTRQAGPTEAADWRAAQDIPVTRIAGPEEPGQPFEYWGRVLDGDGQPLAGASVEAYHTGTNGLYNDPDVGTREPRLKGMATTDAEGRFHFQTIRPGPYPTRDNPEHIHMTVTAAGHALQYVSYWFDDDPLLTPERVAAIDQETRIVRILHGGQGHFFLAPDIRLCAD